MSRDILHAQLQTSRSTASERGQKRQLAVQVGRRFDYDVRRAAYHFAA